MDTFHVGVLGVVLLGQPDSAGLPEPGPGVPPEEFRQGNPSHHGAGEGRGGEGGGGMVGD